MSHSTSENLAPSAIKAVSVRGVVYPLSLWISNWNFQVSNKTQMSEMVISEEEEEQPDVETKSVWLKYKQSQCDLNTKIWRKL